MKQLVADEMATIFEGALDEILRKTPHNVQSGVQSVLYNFVEQVNIDLLLKDLIGDTLDAHIMNKFNAYVAAEGLSKSLLTSSSLMAPIATLVRRNAYTVMNNMEDSVFNASKELMNPVELYEDGRASPPSRLESLTEEIPRRNSSKCNSKVRHNTCDNKNVKRHSY